MLLEIPLSIVLAVLAYRAWQGGRQDPDDNVSPIFAVAFLVSAVSLLVF